MTNAYAAAPATSTKSLLFQLGIVFIRVTPSSPKEELTCVFQLLNHDRNRRSGRELLGSFVQAEIICSPSQ
jgi:hypothetical protein